MERDGFRYEGGRFASDALNVVTADAPTLVQLTEAYIQEHLEKARQKIINADPAGAIANAYTLVEEFLKQLLRKTGITFNENEGDIRALYKLLAEPLHLAPKGNSLEGYLKAILEGCAAPDRGPVRAGQQSKRPARPQVQPRAASCAACGERGLHALRVPARIL